MEIGREVAISYTISEDVAALDPAYRPTHPFYFADLGRNGNNVC